MLKVVSFDIGGTLLDTHNKSQFNNDLKSALEKYGIKSHAAIECLRLKNFSIEEYCNYLGLNCVEEIYDLVKRNTEKHYLYDEVKEVLSNLKNDYKLVSISNAVSIKKHSLSDYQIGYFFDLELYSYQFGEVKPNIKMFKYAEKFFSVSGNECIHIGDTGNDVVGARRAGWNSILLSRDGNILLNDSHPDYVIKNLRELREILAVI